MILWSYLYYLYKLYIYICCITYSIFNINYNYYRNLEDVNIILEGDNLGKFLGKSITRFNFKRRAC
jgi:hypothetical protein